MSTKESTGERAGAKVQDYDAREQERERKLGPNYKWIVLSNTTLGALMAAIDGSIVLISLPQIFAGLGINPLVPANIGLLIWMLLGYLVVSAVFLVTIGRLSDRYGRVKLYNRGFLIFAVSSILICVSSYLVTGVTGALSIIILRLVQAIGGSFLFANSAALLTDAFPRYERGMALGINGIAFASGSMIGLIIGGLLAAIDWHLIFLISVPVGIIGAVWSYLALHEIAELHRGKKLDIPGNFTFATSLTLLLISLTYALLPYGASSTGWGSPYVLAGFALGFVLLIAFVVIESRTEEPMFNIGLFRNRNFALGNVSLLFAGIARGGLQFMIVIWLQGIWLPLHGISFANTPFQAALYMLPLTAGVLIFGPISGRLSDKYGSRAFTTLGMLLNVLGFLVLSTFPAVFALLPFILVTFLLGVGQGFFISPNISSIMNSVPPERRGASSGMRSTFQSVSLMFSIIIFFTLLVAGFSSSLPNSIYNGLISNGVSASNATMISSIPPTSALFAAFLGYNPLKVLIPAGIFNSLSAAQQSIIAGTSFFPGLIAQPFMQGMTVVLYIAAVMALIAAAASALSGKNKAYDEA